MIPIFPSRQAAETCRLNLAGTVGLTIGLIARVDNLGWDTHQRTEKEGIGQYTFFKRAPKHATKSSRCAGRWHVRSTGWTGAIWPFGSG
jgi:hypothetical protein